MSVTIHAQFYSFVDTIFPDQNYHHISHIPEKMIVCSMGLELKKNNMTTFWDKLI